jgi:hypothetical protein
MAVAEIGQLAPDLIWLPQAGIITSLVSCSGIL